MKNFILVFIMFFALGVFGQTDASQQNSEQKNNNYVEPVQIPGTNYTFIPPAHFKLFQEGEQFGFIHPGAMSSMQIKIVENIPFTMLAMSMTSTAVEKQGAHLLAQENVKTKDGKDAVLFLISYSIDVPEMQQKIQFERLMLLTGTYNTTIWIDANYPEQVRPLLYNVMLDSMLSIKF